MPRCQNSKQEVPLCERQDASETPNPRVAIRSTRIVASGHLVIWALDLVIDQTTRCPHAKIQNKKYLCASGRTLRKRRIHELPYHPRELWHLVTWSFGHWIWSLTRRPDAHMPKFKTRSTSVRAA